MPIYQFENKHIIPIKKTQFMAEGIQERADLQVALKENISVISPDTLIIAEEFSDWAESARRIDLLGVDKKANLIVIELKRDETGSHMELQTLRYAAMVSTLTFQRAVEIYQKYIEKNSLGINAEDSLLEFLDWEDPLEQEFPQDTKILLASGDFSKELTTTVMWLNERDLDIRCIRLQPYKHKEEILLHIEQIIPLPEAEEYQIKVRKQSEAKRAAARSNRDFTKYKFVDEVYNKRQLVLAVIKHYLEGNPHTTFDELSDIFPENLHSSFGAFASQEQAQMKSGRYFIKEEQLLKTGDNQIIAVCNQWGLGNIKPFLKIAEELGYEIVPV